MKSRINIALIDLEMGNLKSVQNSLDYLGYDYEIVQSSKDLNNYTHIILPGVGSFKKAMNKLKETKLKEKIIYAVKYKKVKILGICLGMQLLGSSSDENGLTKGLSLIKNKVRKFKRTELKKLNLPHVGFNNIKVNTNDNNFFSNLPKKIDFYFVHAYRMLVEDLKCDYATCIYGIKFLASFNKDNIFDTQFHPEKSQDNGLNLLKNFITNA